MRKRDPLFFSQSKFEFGDSVYKAKDVTFYQHKGNRYMNVGGREFAKQIVAGPINVYERTIILPSGGAGMGGPHMGAASNMGSFSSMPSAGVGGFSRGPAGGSAKKVPYLQAGGPYQPLVRMTYQNTRQLIPQSAELDKFVKTRSVIRTINWSSAGLLLGGFAAVVVSDNSTVKAIGGGAMAAGLLAPIASLTLSVKNSTRPFQAVLDYNQRSKRRAARATAVR